jgi:hypothetical protein
MMNAEWGNFLILLSAFIILHSLMAEFTHRQQRPGPGIEYGEVRFPDEHELGTGSYTVGIEPDALAGDRPVAALLVKRPDFQLALEINPQSHEAVVTFGRADGAEPALQSVFRLPAQEPAGTATRVFRVLFERWVVRGLTLDDSALEKIGPMVN